jgi:hypothetical protein
LLAGGEAQGGRRDREEKMGMVAAPAEVPTSAAEVDICGDSTDQHAASAHRPAADEHEKELAADEREAGASVAGTGTPPMSTRRWRTSRRPPLHRQR